MKRIHVGRIVSMVFALGLLTASCEQKEEPPPGPAEQMGRELDQSMQEAVEKTKELQQKFGKKLEETGKDMQKPE